MDIQSGVQRPLRIACVTETYPPEVNGVARTVLMNDGGFALKNPDIATMQDFRQIVVAELAFSATDHDIEFDVLNADVPELAQTRARVAFTA